MLIFYYCVAGIRQIKTGGGNARNTKNYNILAINSQYTNIQRQYVCKFERELRGCCFNIKFPQKKARTVWNSTRREFPLSWIHWIFKTWTIYVNIIDTSWNSQATANDCKIFFRDDRSFQRVFVVRRNFYFKLCDVSKYY